MSALLHFLITEIAASHYNNLLSNFNEKHNRVMLCRVLRDTSLFWEIVCKNIL